MSVPSSAIRPAGSTGHPSAVASSFVPTCLPAPRAGVPDSGSPGGLSQSLVALAQRGPRTSAFTLVVAGFPGLRFETDHERAVVERQHAEAGLDRVALAYLRGDRAAGGPPGEYLATLGEQLRNAERSRPRVLKAELTGPLSQALQIVDEHERPMAYDPAFCEALAQHTVLRTRWLHDQLAMAGAGALVCLDEPFLDALNSPFCPLDWEEGIDLLARTLQEVPGQRGLCTTNPPDWKTLVELPVEVVFFNACEHSTGLIAAGAAIGGWLERGGVLGWGIVPAEAAALAAGQVESLTRRFVAGVEALAAVSGLSCARIASQALISTSGTIAHLPAAQASHAATLCAAVAAAVRSAYGFEGMATPDVALAQP